MCSKMDKTWSIKKEISGSIKVRPISEKLTLPLNLLVGKINGKVDPWDDVQSE